MGAYTGRAADLPEGSVAATAELVFIKGYGFWLCTDGTAYGDQDIDQRLARDGGQFLRVGDGR